MRNLHAPLFCRSLMFILAILFSATRLTAQTDIAIGTGTTGNANTSYPAPLQDYYEGSRAQYLYTAAELTAAGMSSGNISAIKFDVQALATSTNTMFAIEQYQIKIGSSSVTSLTATSWEPGTTPVYGPVDYNVTLGINTFTFSAPFVWNGTDNIIVEVCNGDPNNATTTTYTGNSVVPWTTGLSFNGSHTYRIDGAGNLCNTTVTTNTGTQTTRPNIIFTWTNASACSGTPPGGAAVASVSSVCTSTTSFSVNVTGSSTSSGLTYKWQSSTDNINYTDIPGATAATYTSPGISVNTYFRRITLCGANSGTSSGTQVTIQPPTYALLPFSESFESNWLSICNTNDAPNNSWRNTPATGDQSWRRNDDGASANWANAGLGIYTPTSSVGNFSARFHSYQPPAGNKGRLDLYVNANTAAANKALSFDYINTSGTDSLVVYFSTNGGTSFTRIDSVRNALTWTTKTVYFNSSSATTVIRFEGTADDGTTDIGLDNIILQDFPNCSGTPVGGTTQSTLTTVCNPSTPFTLSVTGSTNAAGLTYQWEMSTNGGANWTPINGATGATYTSPGISVNTSFRRLTICGASNAPSTPVAVSTNAPSYTTLPFTESFEATWIDVCSTRDVPNNFWRNNPVTGNNSWRRNDDPAGGSWTLPNNGPYTPPASDGAFSARFHTYEAARATTGQILLYINANTPSPTKRLSFDYINTSGTDSLSISISTNGGTSFVRLDSIHNAATWLTKQIVFTSTSATTVIRWEATSDFGVTDIGIDNIRITDFPACTGTPNGGTTVSTSTNVCPGTPFTLSVTGATDASGLTYQWEMSTNGGTTWTPITGAIGATYTSAGITTPTSYHRLTICGAASAPSTTLTVLVNAPDYAPMPYYESFENTWVNSCGTRDIPNNYWRNVPITGSSSWRRDDDYLGGGWANNTGFYTPPGSVGLHSARFHTWQAPDGAKGSLSLYLNCNTGSEPKRLSFDVINVTGDDSLTIWLSLNGGATFVRLDSTGIAATWRTKNINFLSTSPTTVIKFEATSDFGANDIGIDNIGIIDFADCTGVPNGGTAQSTSTNVCTEPFTLSLTGSTSAAGLTYQWQKSTNNGQTWTDIPGATTINYTTSQVGTTLYRAVVKCNLSNQSANSTPVQVISPLPARGIYTINSATATNIPARTFQTFNDAYNYIKCGIDSAVRFDVINGPYNEQLIMNAIPGTSAANTVTFKGNGTAAIGFGSANANERAVIKLRGTRYIIFDSLIINANTGTYGYGVQLMTNADSNIIRNCTINSSLTVNTTNYSGIVVNGTDAGPVATATTVLCDYNEFSKNTIIGGYYGITLVATFTGGANGNNRIVDNDIKDFYNVGIYVAGTYNTLIEANRISRPTRASVIEFNGIYFTTQKNTGCIVSKNRIFNPYGGAPTGSTGANGINFINTDGSVGAENIVSNNLIYNLNGSGQVTGISNTGSDLVYYLHNTISLDEATSTSTSTARGFYQTTLAGGIFFYNNIISITRGGTGAKHAIYLATSLLAGADNNDYYVNAAGGTNFVGYYTANRATLNDWRAATNHDPNSLSAVPAYVDAPNGNYAPGNAGLNDQGIPVGINDDILNAPRSQSTPDIGAYEFTPPACSTPPVNGATSLSATVICQNQPVFLSLNIGPYGSGQSFQWQTSTTQNGTYSNLGTALITPDTTILSTTTLWYRAAVSCGSTVVFSNPVLLTVNPALPSGTYTINPGGGNTYVPGVAGGNFTSFNNAKAAMSCGIFGGPVVFNVVSGTGPYNEQLKLDSIAGVTAVNNITFNGNGNTLTFSSANSTERATLKLNGADHIVFDSLVVDGSAGTYGYGLQLINNADSNTFRRCTIRSSLTSTSTNYAAVVINSTDAGPVVTGATLCDSNRFERNRIIGGYYGVALVGSTTAATFVANNAFVGNTISDYYNTGFYLAGTVGTLIEGNTFTRPTVTTAVTTIYDIYLTASISNGLQITKNRFTKLFGGTPTTTATHYGVFHNSVDAAAGNETIVSNNLFYYLDGNGSHYPFWNVGSNNVFYYHNTISMDNVSSTATAPSAAFYQTTLATGLQFKNNLITITRGGTGAKHGIYVNTTTSEIESNWNNFYINANNAHVGFYNLANRTTLASWVAAATPDDTSSVAMNPLYADSANGNFRPQLAALDNKGKGGLNVPVDITGTARNPTTPDIGAYEFAPIPCQNPPVPGTASVTPSTGICLEAPIHLAINGHSPLGNITFQWQTSTSSTGPWTNIGPLQFFPDFDTLATTSTYYRAIVTCGTTSSTTNVVNVNLNNLLLAGTYSIDPAQPTGGTNFQTFQAAVNALLCGVTGPVIFEAESGVYTEQIRIPYIPGMSNVNNVTFRSRSGSANSVNLTFASTLAASNYTLRLDSAKWFTFKNITISAITPAFGHAVELTNGASSDSFVTCRIVSPLVTNSANTAAGVFATAFTGRNIVLKGNEFNGGANGIYFAGTSATALANPGHVIDSNTVSDAYNHGIFVQYAKNIIISKNMVALKGAPAASTAGIYTNYADSASRILGNTVTVNGVTTGPVYGYFLQNTRALLTDSAIVASNKVTADSNNVNTVYGLTVTLSRGVSVVNNVIGINSSGATTYGLYNLNNIDEVNYYNNTVNVTTNATNGYPGYFSQTALGVFNVKNNIFSNRGGGRALFVNNPAFFTGDYNMLYTTGANLVTVATGTQLNFPTLLSWNKTWNWDRSSITYNPAFISNTDLRPNLATPDVWAMHGRGVQIRGNTYDFNKNYRPDALTKGVPDLGAYEFFPTVLPTVLTATPAVPQPNTEQIFTYGTDTVMKITWKAVAPPSVEVRRFSGVVPSGLPTGMDSMFFYTKVDIPGGANYNYSAKLYYIDSWQGSIPNQAQLGLGRTTPSNAWVVGANSAVDVAKKEIRQDAIVYLDRFTGLVNPFATPEAEDSSSNRGKDFWVGYQRTNGFTGTNGGAQQMVLYMGASAVPANVRVEIEFGGGNNWVRNYFVPANSAVQSDFIPKVAPQDARLTTEGLHLKKGIHITSDVPIVAYAHIYESTNSGATMLMPTAVWGYEYYILSSRQNYSSESSSAFHIVAKDDSTWVEINPSKPTRNGWVPNGGTRPNGSYLVKLNKGDAYQVLGAIITGAEGQDLTGSYVKSVGNAQGTCAPIAVFSGSTRTAIGCGTSAGSTGDLIIQQIFPYQAWGNKYLTAPTSIETGPNNASNMTNLFRIMVKDPNTIVKRNNIQIPINTLINSRYYQYESNTPDYIESNKPILVAQYMSSSGSCPNTAGDGDPEMFYLSPVQQAIKSSQFYRNNLNTITQNFITLVIPTEGLQTLRIDGVNYQAYPATERFVYNHSLAGYSVVTKRWAAPPNAPGRGSSTVESDFPFTGIVYGEGDVESYGYNIGTLVKNLNNLSSVNNVLNTGQNSTEYTCKNAPFTVTALLPLVPDSIRWLFSQVPHLSPAVNVLTNNPVPYDTVTVNGLDYYAFTITQQFTFDSAGIFNIPIQFYSQEIESCDKSQIGRVVVQVLPSPITDFAIAYPGGTSACEGDQLRFTGDVVTTNGIALSQWLWTFHNGSTPSGQIQTFTYPTPGTFPVKLRGITADGCISDTTKNVVINPKPVVQVAVDSIGICSGSSVTFTVTNPQAGVTYNWYDVPTGGTILATGTSYTANNVSPLPKSFYIEGVSAAGCASATRKKVTAYSLSTLAQPTVSVTGSTANSVTFSWNAVPNSSGYQVSVNSGPFVTPSSGPTGLTHTVTGLTTLQSASIVVRALGSNSCQNSESAATSGCANSSAAVTVDSFAVCTGDNATFTVQNPATGVTYTWWNAATGGTQVGTGTSFTVNNVTGTAQYWVQQSNGSCTGSPRTRVVVTVFQPLASTVVTATGSTANSVTFTWTAVPGAVSYQVSVNGGAFVTPSSGATGLTHTVTGLTTLQNVTLVVRAVGANTCQNSLSNTASGCANSSAVVSPDSLAVCSGTTATFNVQNPVTGITYTWWTAPTGGTQVGTGASFTTPSITATTVYYVQQSSTSCTGTVRTRVVVTVLQQLTPAVVTVSNTGPNSITWTWTAVPGAATYQVSIDGGTTFVTPSSGATGLSHTITGLIPLTQVTLVVRAVGSITCQNSLSLPVTGRTLPDDIYIPNSFTPNGDGLNDRLLVYGYTIQSMQFMIFNQWGQKIFESSNQSVGWDGTYKGKAQPSGVYIYVARFVLKDGTEVNRKGATNLIR